MKSQRGFSLVELLIVVGIILVISAIAIPNLLRSKIAANESSAVGSVRTVNTAQVTYQSTYPSIGYACNVSWLGPPPGLGNPMPFSAGLIDQQLATGVKSGYQLKLNCTSFGTNTTYRLEATPVAIGKSGERAFCSDPTAVISYSPDGLAASCVVGGNTL